MNITVTWVPALETESLSLFVYSSDTAVKRRRRYSHVKRKSLAPSPKQGPSSGGGPITGIGGAKMGGAAAKTGQYDSDAERSKPARRRKARRSQRARQALAAAEADTAVSNLTEGEGPEEDGPLAAAQGRLVSTSCVVLSCVCQCYIASWRCALVKPCIYV